MKCRVLFLSSQILGLNLIKIYSSVPELPRAGRQTDRQTGRQSDRETDRQAERQTDTKTDRKADKETQKI